MHLLSVGGAAYRTDWRVGMPNRDPLKSRRGGTSSLEYGLIAGLVSIGFIAGLVVLSNGVGGTYNFISSSVTGGMIYNPNSGTMQSGDGSAPTPVEEGGGGGNSDGNYSDN